MQTYQQFKQFAETRRARKLANNTYLVERDDNGYGIRLHNTEVVIHYPDHIVLNSGGWQTVTTKARMNEFSNARLWAEKGVWFVSWQGTTYPYADHIKLYDDGTVTGEGDDPKATIKLRKKINKYAKDYAQAFVNGDVPAPNGGDCWGCLMVATDGTAPMGGSSHILSHIDDKYYVPSIVNRMADSGVFSIMDKDYIARAWSDSHETPTGWQAEMAQERITKAVKKFCFQELGLAA